MSPSSRGEPASPSRVAAKALGSQLGAWLLILLAAPLLAKDPSMMVLAIAQGLAAATLGAALRSDRWWIAIHLAFSPALVAARSSGLAPEWFLAGFLVLLLIYWTPFRSRVPLYLSNAATARALIGLIPPRAGVRMIDLGSGTGTLLARCAAQRTQCAFTGVENAPLPYLISRIACRGSPKVALRLGDFRDEDLSGYDIVYAFLSPAAMPGLGRKLDRELSPGALFVSNSFPLPDRAADEVLELPDRRRTRLYCYRARSCGRGG
ncbi:MAG: hypothetical protein OHK0026_16030 [Rhodocyclaceae bacterium]